MKIIKLLSSSDVLKDTTCFERTKYKLFGTDHYFSSGGRGGGDKHCFACKKLNFFLFAATNNLCGGLHTIYFGLLRLQIILFSLSGSANNLFQPFSVPHPTCKQYIVYIRLALTARTFRMKFVCEMLPYCCIKA